MNSKNFVIGIQKVIRNFPDRFHRVRHYLDKVENIFVRPTPNNFSLVWGAWGQFVRQEWDKALTLKKGSVSMIFVAD